MKRVLHLIILLALPVGLYANPIIGAISIDSYELRSESGELYIDIDISLPPLDFAPNERVVITPSIQADGQERLSLPDIVVGRRGALISHLRDVEPIYGEGLWSEPQGVIRVSRKYGSQYRYSLRLEDEEWMQRGDLTISCRYLNCRDVSESSLLATIYHQDALPLEPLELPDNQEDIVSAEPTTTMSLLFEKGESTLNLDYASNREVAQSLNSLISSGDVEELSIVGYANRKSRKSITICL